MSSVELLQPHMVTGASLKGVIAGQLPLTPGLSMPHRIRQETYL